jgi:hypothetical protein
VKCILLPNLFLGCGGALDTVSPSFLTPRTFSSQGPNNRTPPPPSLGVGGDLQGQEVMGSTLDLGIRLDDIDNDISQSLNLITCKVGMIGLLKRFFFWG